MEFKDRLRELRSGIDLTQEELGKRFNVIKQTISSWENGNSRPDIDMALDLAKFFGVSTDYLLGLKSTESTSSVPLLGPIRAGVPILSDDNYTETVTPPEGVRADFASPVEGDSMIYAGIHPGDIAFFRECGEAHTGQIVAARLWDMDAAVNLKFYVQKNGQAVLRSANPEYADIPFTHNHAVVGVMTGLIRDGAPILNDYERLLLTNESINQKWSIAVNGAIADGISPEQFTAMLGLMKNYMKRD
jgi:repressor LexA